MRSSPISKVNSWEERHFVQYRQRRRYYWIYLWLCVAQQCSSVRGTNSADPNSKWLLIELRHSREFEELSGEPNLANHPPVFFYIYVIPETLLIFTQTAVIAHITRESLLRI
ncbi:hypothetical protein GQX74_003664 [Glossina fuscipes]|nr:hypothetical protein GQX74_003664 [Glossina fuscipes]